MIRVASVAALLVLAAGLGLSAASAAALDVTSASALTVERLSACSNAMGEDGPVLGATVGDAESAVLNDIPLECAGLPLELFLHDATGSVLASGATTSADGTQTVVLGSYAADAVEDAVARIGGWVFPASWEGDAAPVQECVGVDAQGSPTGAACVLTITSVNSWTDSGVTWVVVDFTAVTDAPLWQVSFDLSDHETFPAITPAQVGTYQNLALAPGYSCSQLPLLVGIEANPSWNSTSGSLIYTSAAVSSMPGALCT